MGFVAWKEKKFLNKNKVFDKWGVDGLNYTEPFSV